MDRGGSSEDRSPNDDRSDVMNPNNDAWEADQANRESQEDDESEAEGNDSRLAKTSVSHSFPCGWSCCGRADGRSALPSGFVHVMVVDVAAEQPDSASGPGMHTDDTWK